MEEREEWREYSGVVASTHPVDTYGGVALDRRTLEQIVSALNTGAMPMLGFHDRARPVRTRDVRAWVTDLSDGHSQVEVQGLVYAPDWELLGDVRAFSVAFGVDLDSDLWPTPSAPGLVVAADAAWFDVSAIARASAAMADIGDVKAQEYFQFNAVSTAKVVIEASLPLLSAVGFNVACSALWDGVKVLFARRRTPPGGSPASPTTVELHLTEGSRRLDYLIVTPDAQVARAAIYELLKVLDQHAAESQAPQRVLSTWQMPDGSGGSGRWTAPQ